jgi:formylglycine-generating enzyme required for sulfatase activity
MYGLMRQNATMKRRREPLPTLKRKALWQVLFLVSTALVVYLVRQASVEPVRSDARTELLRRLAASDAAQGAAQLAEVLDRDLVSVPEGNFLMGSNADRTDERPLHTVYLDSFEIDRFEITNAQYQRYLQVTGRKPPPYWDGDMYPVGQADYPVVGVSWDDADAYCAWAGKRLPTEAEWEKACRGTDSRIFPWGDQWEPSRANVDLSGRAGADPSVWQVAWGLVRATGNRAGPGLRPVGSYRDGASFYGVLDMVGNASEWVADWYNWSDYFHLPARNPRNLGPPWNHSLRGSPWHDPTGDADWVQNMSRCSARNSSHETQDPRVGLRCVRSLP